ncbi:polyprotein [Panicum miliaceum]|uniref:Polyprotein n=1 Tax=Panicum miliaceum TaxID=4540 RepID=A0A3L6R6D9_PANMI|nr:polyprotein [Panicum miliaceum]
MPQTRQLPERMQAGAPMLSFRGLRPEEPSSCDFHSCKQGDKETLQDYLQRIVKLRAWAPRVAKESVIDAAIMGLRMGSCAEYLEMCKLDSVKELFEIMQQYSKSDRGWRRRLEALNEHKKARGSQWSQLKPWHVEQPKQPVQRRVNTVSGGQDVQESHPPSN